MTEQYRRYDRVSRVRMLRGIIASLVVVCAMLCYALFAVGSQVEQMQEQLAEMTAAVTMMRETE